MVIRQYTDFFRLFRDFDDFYFQRVVRPADRLRHAVGNGAVVERPDDEVVSGPREFGRAGLFGDRLLDRLGERLRSGDLDPEEGGGGKILMLEAGMFQGIDYAMMIHPCDATMVEDWSLAGQTITFRFYGKSAHCAASPWLGANALAAAAETVNMVNAWRSQFKDFSRVFPNITHGGEATNVIPDLKARKSNHILFGWRLSEHRRCEHYSFADE